MCVSKVLNQKFNYQSEEKEPVSKILFPLPSFVLSFSFLSLVADRMHVQEIYHELAFASENNLEN